MQDVAQPEARISGACCTGHLKKNKVSCEDSDKFIYEIFKKLMLSLAKRNSPTPTEHYVPLPC
jgi:hypothetical protein